MIFCKSCGNGENKNLFVSTTADTASYPRPGLIPFIQSRVLHSYKLLWISTLKTEKLLVFRFSECLSFGKMTNLLFIPFAFLLVCGTIVPVKQRSAEHAEDLLTEELNSFSRKHSWQCSVHAGPAYPTEYKHGTSD